MRGKLVVGLCLPVVVLVGQLAVSGGAGASAVQATVVSADPTDVTPHVIGGNVNKFALVGQTMFAGGTIAQVRQQGSQVVQARHNLMAFSATTGVVLPFAPVVNGEVWSLQPGPGNSLFVAGAFSSVDGVPRTGLVKIDLATQRVVPAFDARLDGAVTDVQLVRGQLVVAGRFKRAGGVLRPFLASLDPATGNATPYLNLEIGGSVIPGAGMPHVYRFAVNPAATRMVLMGNFTTVARASRHRIAMVNLSSTAAALATFNDIRFYEHCDQRMPAYFRDVDWSPDGSYFVLVSTGLFGPGSLCDSVARFDDFTGNSGPTWVNRTGGDTLHSVAVTGAAVYVGGHQRWLDNPFGRKFPGPGAVSRPGVGAIHPTTGKALAWNPTRSRGIGAKELYPTYAAGIQGLWIGSDTDLLGGELHGSIGFFPLT